MLKVMNKVIAGTAMLAISILFNGCAAKQLNPGAEKVIVSRTAAPKSCKFAGTVVGEQGGAFTGGWTSNKNLAVGAMNDLKNRAAALGANYVVMETNQAGSTMGGGADGLGGMYMSGGQTDVTSMGNAYKCPAEEIGLN